MEKLGLTEAQYKNQPIWSWGKKILRLGKNVLIIVIVMLHIQLVIGDSCDEVRSWTRGLGWMWSPRYYKKGN